MRENSSVQKRSRTDFTDEKPETKRAKIQVLKLNIFFFIQILNIFIFRNQVNVKLNIKFLLRHRKIKKMIVS